MRTWIRGTAGGFASALSGVLFVFSTQPDVGQDAAPSPLIAVLLGCAVGGVLAVLVRTLPAVSSRAVCARGFTSGLVAAGVAIVTVTGLEADRGQDSGKLPVLTFVVGAVLAGAVTAGCSLLARWATRRRVAVR